MPQDPAEIGLRQAAPDELDFAALRADFPIFGAAHPRLHYLDSAASAQKPVCVVEAVADCYTRAYGPVHRGLYPLAEQASEQYEAARQTLAKFLNAASAEQIVFTRSATEAINLVASGWAAKKLQAGDEIWVSEMEHHSNYLPWQRICRERGARLRVIPLDGAGRLHLAAATAAFGDKSRLIAITQVSNVLGTINPIKSIAERAQRRGIALLVDAAQSLGHLPVDVDELGCDFLVASAHKMCGPSGIGLLYAKSKRLSETEPLLLGGGMVDQVGLDESRWADIPARFEAGSPNLSGAVGFASAVDYLNRVGVDAIEAWVRNLIGRAYARLAEVEGLTLYGPEPTAERGGILAFNVDGIHPHDIAQVAGERGVAIRAGHHCCQPLMRALGVSSTARASFHLYNSEQDIDALAAAIDEAKRIFTR